MTAVDMVARVEHRQRMEHRIGPAQLLLSELLPLPANELAARLTSELDANPALELPEPATCAACGHPVWRGRCTTCPFVALHERTADPVSMQSAPAAPRERLLTDAAATLAPGDRAIAAHLVADLDVYGVLDEPVPRVAKRIGVTDGDVRRVIASLRRAGWPGLCAGSVAESLRLQAVAAGGPHLPPEVRTLLAAGLDMLVAPVPITVLPPAQLRRALSWLRVHITAEVFECAESTTVAPVDIVVRRTGHQFRADVVAGPWSAARVAESYRAAAGDPAVDAALECADRFVTAVERRERAVKRVGDAVVARQAGRMLAGRSAHRPLTRREVAGELGLHESTVSRVVAGKHVALPSGETIALASLFGSGHDAQECLREVIGSEEVPLSDSALAAAMSRRGHRVARRTVAKYRAELGIPDVGRRVVAGTRRPAALPV